MGTDPFADAKLTQTQQANSMIIHRTLALLGLALATACAGHDDSTHRSPNTLESGGSRLEPVTPAEELHATILDVRTEGELCPPWTADQDHNGLPDNISVSAAGSVDILGGAAVQPGATTTTTTSAEPSCSVTLELEVPEGYQLGIPFTIWRGFSGGTAGSVDLVRSYAFEGGEASAPRTSSNLTNDFEILDGAVSSTYSPTCSGTQRVRVNATLTARGSTTEKLQLDKVELLTQWRYGTEWRQGCSPAVLVIAPAGAADEWCEGRQHRACATGLTCEFNQAHLTTDGDPAEGACVDVSEVVPAAGVHQSCGGLRDIPCASGTSCWHKTQQLADARWLGNCIGDPGNLPLDPCHTGVPALECAAPLACWDRNGVCVEATGRVDSPCGEPDLPVCASSLYCNSISGRCTAPQGGAGDPCDSPEYPVCASPIFCENGVCKDPRSHLNEPCGTAECIPQLSCSAGFCRAQ